MKNFLSAIFTLQAVCLSLVFANAQIIMPANGNSNVTACSGSFYDSGGANGNYPNNANQTLTICSGNGFPIQVTINNYNFESGWDYLRVYNGTDATGTMLVELTGTGNTVVVQSTGGATCLTFVFTSDGSGVRSGFEGSVRCMIPCQDFTSSITGITPGVVNGNEIKLCQGDSMQASGTAVFPNNGVNYNQTIANSRFKWRFSDGYEYIGTNINRVFTNYGIYRLTLQVTDTNQCIQTNPSQELYVKVAAKPTFTGTQALDDTVCVNELFNLTGQHQNKTSTFVCQNEVAGVTFLPDGTGVSYRTSALADCFGSAATVQSASDVASICVNMEHSYMGDIRIRMICPSGQAVTLLPNLGLGVGTYLGAPIDNGPGPGVGADYCFSMSAALPTIRNANVAANWVQAGTPAGNSMRAGTYQPEQSFAGFIGCPLNGNWTIEVTDNLAVDDGYIFSWNINFAPGLTLTVPPFTPVTTYENWTGSQIVSQFNGDATAISTVDGTQCYTYTVRNDFDCQYDTTVCVNIRPLPEAGLDTVLRFCADAQVVDLIDYLASDTAHLSTNAVWTGPSALANGFRGTFDPNYNTLGIYKIRVFSPYGCGPDSAQIDVVVSEKPVVTYTGPDAVCGDKALLTSSATIPPPFSIAGYEWYVGNNLVGTGSPFTYNSPQSPTTPVNGFVVAESDLGCRDTTDFMFIMFANPLAQFTVDDHCTGLSVNIQNSSEFQGIPSNGSTLTYQWNFGDASTSLPTDVVNGHTYGQGGTYTITLVATSSEYPCKDTAKVTITVEPLPVPEFKYEISCFQNVKFSSLAVVQPPATIQSYSWNLGDGGTASDSSFSYDYANSGLYDVIFSITTGEGCVLTDTQQVDINASAELSKLELPNIITPNGDGVNDDFFIDEMYDDCYNYTFSLFNRWGALVFRTEISDKGLTGKSNLGSKLTDGVYFWTLVGRGKYINTEEVTKNGTLTVVTTGTK